MAIFECWKISDVSNSSYLCSLFFFNDFAINCINASPCDHLHCLRCKRTNQLSNKVYLVQSSGRGGIVHSCPTHRKTGHYLHAFWLQHEQFQLDQMTLTFGAKQLPLLIATTPFSFDSIKPRFIKTLDRKFGALRLFLRIYSCYY